ncbi:DUF2637 domain-containing protein [Mycolicibacterium austroafricanum]|uniref:DUF2637 domain-containing protein n=1 Tax=Mycolicibacterium austroafricanum TaxID=39687 RepID=UPI001CA37F1D|nr:DUF2637 domain-containing protein [Mycolicibacterium austroafricanum]QZT56244.1 DUF2637 domain-containing protein [Mycolicibacterium austroafricanum]
MKTADKAPAGWLRWKGLLALSLATSIGLNVWHAFIASAAGAAVLASIPPVFLFWITHNQVSGPTRPRNWSRDWVGVAAAAVVALGAFVVSYITQRDLALLLGLDWVVAMILPLIVDITIAVSSLELVREARQQQDAAGAQQAGAVTLSQRVRAWWRSTPADATQPAADRHVDAALLRDEAPASRSVEAPANRDAAPAPTAAQTASVRDAEPQQPAIHVATQQSTTRDALRDADAGELPVTRGESREAAAKHVDEASAPRRLTAVPTPRPTSTQTAASPATQTAPDRDADVDAQLLRRATQLVEAGRTKAPVDAAHRVLRGKSAGETNRDLASETGLTESAVQRIWTAARELDATSEEPEPEPAFA